MLRNLLSNALKYSTRGSVVSVSAGFLIKPTTAGSNKRSSAKQLNSSLLTATRTASIMSNMLSVAGAAAARTGSLMSNGKFRVGDDSSIGTGTRARLRLP